FDDEAIAAEAPPAITLSVGEAWPRRFPAWAGQIKQARGFHQFLLRGVEKVRAEWAMICTAHNRLTLFTRAKAA
ncbi:MAG: transposase, partial [Candidatus Woesebacteria bacterium]|nr:transposase [Candidatus Woesebacteria bacterium]